MRARTPLDRLWSLLWPTSGAHPRRREPGTCRACADPIAGVRLKLMPTAELCARCQKAVDARVLLRRG
jgi:hypothetical protein